MNENIEELDEEKDIGPEAVNLINKLKKEGVPSNKIIEIIIDTFKENKNKMQADLTACILFLLLC